MWGLFAGRVIEMLRYRGGEILGYANRPVVRGKMQIFRWLARDKFLVRKFVARARRDPMGRVRESAPRPVKIHEELLSARLVEGSVSYLSTAWRLAEGLR
jgi:hypothetical protein